MMIYLWEEPETKNQDIGEYDRGCSPDRFLLTDGRPLSQEEFGIPTVHFEVTKTRLLKFDCLPNNASAPLVNHRVRMLLENLAPDEVQFFQARCLCADGELEGYYYLNVTHTFIGIDHEKSVYRKLKDTEVFSWITYLTYKPGSMGELNLARDKETLSHLLVSEKIKSAFDNLKITGVLLVRPEEYFGPLTEV